MKNVLTVYIIVCIIISCWGNCSTKDLEQYVSYCGSLAQSVEHMTFNHGVPGSIPGWATNLIKDSKYLFYFYDKTGIFCLSKNLHFENKKCKLEITYEITGIREVFINILL